MNAKSKLSIILACIVGVLIVLVFSFFSIRNSFVIMDETIESSWAQVENQMQRRYDLIPNLVNTVKGYAKHESTIFTAIADARSKLLGAKTVNEKVQASRGLESAIGRLLMVAENYPNLKADQQFTRLMDELAGSENRISVERKKYNEHVKVYNTSLRRFPQLIVASVLHLEKRPYFQVEEAAKKAPSVQF